MFLFFWISYNLFLILLNKKIDKLERKIIKQFIKRTNLIPCLFEISKDYLNRHRDVFKESLRLRKIEFANYKNDSFIEIIANEALLHHELNFIFKVINKHPKIQKNWNFLYIRDLVLEKSAKIADNIELHKKITKKFNNLLKLKTLTLIWIFLPIKKRTEI